MEIDLKETQVVINMVPSLCSQAHTTHPIPLAEVWCLHAASATVIYSEGVTLRMIYHS